MYSFKWPLADRYGSWTIKMNLLEREREKGVRAAKESTFIFGDKGDGKLGYPRDTAAVRTAAPPPPPPLTSENERTATPLCYLALIWHRTRELGAHSECCFGNQAQYKHKVVQVKINRAYDASSMNRCRS
jgi:hypothetical protein